MCVSLGDGGSVGSQGKRAAAMACGRPRWSSAVVPIGDGMVKLKKIIDMILQKEVPYVMGKMKELSETHDLVKYISDVRESGNYKVLKNRIACDLIRAACGSTYLCELYDKYGCNDSHITALALRCMKDVGIIVE